ncbi:hypothetical protein [Nonomuraea salmonea]|uniref:hypothetical protein n=1 Tax=Nonomuraea salmonea TaxID=46181 RepID=UPI0031E86237
MSATITASRPGRTQARRPWAADGVVAAAAGVAGVLGSPTVSFATPTQTAYTLLVIGGCAALLLRRRAPRLCLGLLVLLLAVHLPLVQMGPYAGVVCLIGACTTQTRLDAGWRWGGSSPCSTRWPRAASSPRCRRPMVRCSPFRWWRRTRCSRSRR